MRQTTLIWILALTAVSILITACGSAETTQDEHMDDGDHTGDAMEGMDHAHVEAPDEFASLTNPLAGEHEAIEAGNAIFQTNCATCHGPEGRGDGPGAEGLDPKPATLADGSMMNTLSDGYLFWRISKGGQVEPFNSAMPAWETSLSEEQRWQVISFLRTLADDDEHMDGDEHMDDGDHMDDSGHMDDNGHTDDDDHSG